jgi:hypothetical protein
MVVGDLSWDVSTTVVRSVQHLLWEAWDFARGASDEESYHDVHCWVFTPASFARLLASLVELDLVEFSVARFFPTSGHGFSEPRGARPRW